MERPLLVPGRRARIGVVMLTIEHRRDRMPGISARDVLDKIGL